MTFRQQLRSQTSAVLLPILVVVFLVLFAVVWVSIIVRVIWFTPTDQAASPSINDFTVVVAGILAGGLSSFAAGRLGIQIQKDHLGMKEDDGGVAGRAMRALQESRVLSASVAVYVFVSGAALLVALFKTSAAPDIVQSLGMGLIGFLTGAMTAVGKVD